GSVGGQPCLVGIGHDRDGVAEGLTQMGEIGKVARRAEADLELERRVTLVALSQRGLHDMVGSEPARVNFDAPARSAEMLPERYTGAARRHVPHCLIDGAADLRE